MSNQQKRKKQSPSRARSTPQRTSSAQKRRKHNGLNGLPLVLAILFAFFAGGFSSYVLFETDWQSTFSFIDKSIINASGESSEPGTETGSFADLDTTETESETDAVAPNEEEMTEETESDPIEQYAEQLLQEMTLTEKVYQMFMVTPEQLTKFNGTVIQAGETTKKAIEAKPVGGVIYFESNIQTPSQCTEMISDIQSYSKLGLFISVDEEGGRVARLGNNSSMGTTQFPSMAEIGSQGTEAAYHVGYTIGTEIAQYGFNLDFAPVADINTNPDNTVIGERAFSSDAQTAASLVASAVNGFKDSNMLCTLKHFPGHGDTATDSHTGVAVTNKTLDELRAEEFLPFEAGIEAGADFVMVGHISVPNVTGDSVPATLSSTMVTDVLREELGFDGIVITDSMVMNAITDYYNADTAAVMAITAGVDIILMPADLEQAVNGILSAVDSGPITEERIDESVLRILRTKLESGIILMN